SIRNVKVHRGLIWILGEFCDGSESQLQEILNLIKSSLGDVPSVESELQKLEEGGDEAGEKTLAAVPASTTTGGSKLVTADGSYATQSALNVTSNNKAEVNESSLPPLRNYLLNKNEFFI